MHDVCWKWLETKTIWSWSSNPQPATLNCTWATSAFYLWHLFYYYLWKIWHLKIECHLLWDLSYWDLLVCNHWPTMSQVIEESSREKRRCYYEQRCAHPSSRWHGQTHLSPSYLTPMCTPFCMHHGGHILAACAPSSHTSRTSLHDLQLAQEHGHCCPPYHKDPWAREAHAFVGALHLPIALKIAANLR